MVIAMSNPEVQESFKQLVATAESQGRSDEVIIVLLRESTDLLRQRQPRGSGLTSDEADYLVSSNSLTEEQLAEAEAAVARGDLVEIEQKTRLEVITNSLSAAEVAQRLGIDASRVRHRQSKGGLYSFMAGGKRRYPTWQFTDDPKQPVVPGLAVIVKALPEDMHPASVQGLMTTPQDALVVDGRRLTPPEWLRTGGAPEAVVGVLESLLQS